jgi:hypothetical protein
MWRIGVRVTAIKGVGFVGFVLQNCGIVSKKHEIRKSV